MTSKNSSLQHIINCFKTKDTLKPSDIVVLLNKTPVLVHRYLKQLVEQGILIKHGSAPHTWYTWTGVDLVVGYTNLYSDSDFHSDSLGVGATYQQQQIIESSFYKYSAQGVLLCGYKGFVERCTERKLSLTHKISDYCDIYTYLESIRTDCGMIDATKEFHSIVQNTFLDHVYYADQYKWMDFGRGKLAEMTFYAKQSQKISLIGESLDSIVPKLQCLIHSLHIDCIAMVPHSIQRKNQLLTILKKKLLLSNFYRVGIIKDFPNNIPIPQKSLKTREQRLLNAKTTIVVKDDPTIKHKTILLIDDFVGSGSTLNETAYKLKQQGAGTVVGFAFVGNTNLSYDIINEI